MHVVTVIDHPDPASFTHAIAAHFNDGVRAAGHTFETADLNAEGFNPVWTGTDRLQDPQTPSADVVREQARIGRADAI